MKETTLDMRSLPLRLSLILLGSILLAGCRESIAVKRIDSGGNTPVFALQLETAGASAGADITVFSVVELDENGKGLDCVWEIFAADGRPIHLNEISYGYLPLGFKQVSSAKPLLAGRRYNALAGMPGRIGSAVFVWR